jgi:hypothetical protein
MGIFLDIIRDHFLGRICLDWLVCIQGMSSYYYMLEVNHIHALNEIQRSEAQMRTEACKMRLYFHPFRTSSDYLLPFSPFPPNIIMLHVVTSASNWIY